MTERNDSSGRTTAELIGDARVNQCAQKISLELAKTISAIDFGRNSPKNEIPPPSSGSPSWLLRLSENQAWRLKIQWVESPFFEQNLPETSKAPPGSSGSGGGRRVGDPRHGPKRAAGHGNMLVTCRGCNISSVKARHTCDPGPCPLAGASRGLQTPGQGWIVEV